MSLEEILPRMKELEEEGRKRASERDLKPVSDSDFLDSCIVSLEGLMKAFKGTGFSFPLGTWRNILYEVSKKASYCVEQDIKRKDCPIPEESVDQLNRISEILFEEKCTWLLGVKKPYNLSSALNDITSCYHKIIDFADMFDRTWEKSGKCVWRKPK
jgi:hypothetical protein